MSAPNPFPRRPVEPLPPPAGTFDVVVGRARARRTRRASTVIGVTGVFLVGLLGGLSLSGGVSGVQQTIITMANRAGAVATQTATTTSTQTSAAGIPATRHRPSKRATTSSPTVAAPPSSPAVPTAPVVAVGSLAVRGRVVDAARHPVSGLYVYTGSVVSGRFVPTAAPVAVTGRHGRYAVECGGTILLTSWRLNTPLPADAGGAWAATFVRQPRCGLPGHLTTTTVSPGATLEGQVSTDLGCSDVGFGLAVQLWGGGDTTVRLSGLHEGDRYHLSGLPADSHVVVVQGTPEQVTLTGRTTTPDDVTFACPSEPTPTPSPTDTPQPTPSETTTPTSPPTSPTSPTPTGVSVP